MADLFRQLQVAHRAARSGARASARMRFISAVYRFRDVTEARAILLLREPTAH